jgi:hypothetical protein
VIDVKTGSQKFSATWPVPPAGSTTKNTAYLGSFAYKLSQSTTAINTVSATAGVVGPIGAFNVPNGIEGGLPYYRVTIQGAPLAGGGKISLSTAVNCNTAVGKVAFGGASGDIYVVDGVRGAALASPGGIHVCLVQTGTNSISAGSISVTLSRQSSETAKWNYDFSTDRNQLRELKKNGRSFKLYNMNMPEALGGSTVEVSNIRLYNTSSNAGAVRATVYGSDGVKLGTAGAIILDSTTFAPKTAHVVSMTQLLSTLGITAYTGAQRPWILLEGEVPDMDVQVVTRNKTTGVVVNMSPVTRRE